MSLRELVHAEHRRRWPAETFDLPSDGFKESNDASRRGDRLLGSFFHAAKKEFKPSVPVPVFSNASQEVIVALRVAIPF